MIEQLKIYKDKRITIAMIDLFEEQDIIENEGQITDTILNETDTTLTPYNILNVPVIFEDGFTINDIFDLVEANPILQAYCTLFDEFNEERKQSTKDEDLLVGIFEFRWKPYNRELGIDFIQSKMDAYLVEVTDGILSHCPMYFTPVNHFAHLPINIDSTVLKLKYKKHLPKIKKLRECQPSLLYILNGLFSELSFHGNPERRDNEKQYLLEKIRELHDDEELTWEDVIEKSLKTKLTLLKD